jgi:hypothetical protein
MSRDDEMFFKTLEATTVSGALAGVFIDGTSL